MGEGVELIKRFYDEALGRGNTDLIDELTTDDFVDHSPSLPGAPPGKEGVVFFIKTMREAFPDLEATVGPSLEQGDLAAARTMIKGTHKGEFLGVAASDKSFEFESIDIIRVKDGKCVEHWGVGDVMSLMEQIGAIPEPAST
jgi:steroid delta-isomerase-like uncharacterized protein